MLDAQPAPFIPDKARTKAYLFWVAVITLVFMAVYPTINWYTDTRAHRYQLYLPFELDIPLSLLPSAGFSPLQYGFNLWPRDISVTASATQTPIADFAPDNATFVATAVPEPMSVALLVSGVFGLCLLRRRSPS